ncbi:hypothetical protein QA601_13710 [Chitinispirillales bacterium ANBcel5]|uniref:hypothetical protein n=1 Tax=Cellulosispirillum alkaliphilum TaxID=3039283 RepID=UPI002A53E80D|nr:hypothetical protein [Chitinispirillales bacterium ANBcel5]
MKSLHIFCIIPLVLIVFAFAENGSIIRFGSDISVPRGEEVRDAVAIGGNVEVAGTVKNDAVAIGGSVTLHQGADVNGNVVSIAGTITQAEGAIVGGDVVEITGPWEMVPPETLFQILVGARIAMFVALLVLLLLIVALLPDQITSLASVIKTEPAKTVLWGIIATVAIVPVIILLAISVIGIFVIPFFILAVVIAFFVGYIAVSVFVGDALLRAMQKPDVPVIWKGLLGYIVLGVVGWIPVLGWLVSSVASVLGIGAVLELLIRSRAGKVKNTNS